MEIEVYEKEEVMNSDQCKQFNEKLGEIETLQKLYAAAVADAARSGDMARARSLSDQLKKTIIRLRYEVREKTDKYGLIERDRIATEKGYSYVGQFSGGEFTRAQLPSGEWVFIDRAGERVGNRTYKTIKELIFETTAWIADGNQHDLVDIKTGKTGMQGPRDIFEIVGHREGITHVRIGGNRHLFFRPSGRMIGDRSFRDADSFSEGRARVQFSLDEEYYIDTSGSVISQQYRSATSFKNGRAFVEFNGKKGFFMIDEQGRVVAGPYREANKFSDGLAEVEMKKKPLFRAPRAVRGYVDTNGKKVLFSEQFDATRRCSEGFVSAHVAGKGWQIMAKDGTVLADGLADAGQFSEGIAAIQEDIEQPAGSGARYAYIDTQGRRITPEFFRKAHAFHDGVAWVQRTDDRYYLMDKNGTILTPDGFYWSNSFSEGVAEVKEEKGPSSPKYYIDTRGRTVFAPQQ